MLNDDQINAQFDCWVVNTESNAASRYENYPFQSMMRIGDNFYATTDDGIALLGGDDDNGENIHAMLITGKTDFGSPNIKSLTQISMGYVAEQPLVVSAIYTDAGNEAMVSYQVNPGYTGIEREARVKVGRGAKSRYWQFMFENTNGGSMTLDRVDFDVAKLARRVR